MKFSATILTALLSATPFLSYADAPLRGTPIGTVAGYDYDAGKRVDNIQGRAFDGDLNTSFATDARSYTWVGLDLAVPHVITKVGWAPRNDTLGPGRLELGIIQGANSPDFLDAVPICIIREKGVIGKMTYADVDCSKGFRYVRFVSTSDSRCNIAELEFYGSEGEGDDSSLFQITNLPTVVINTVDSQEPYDKEHDITANVIIIDGNTISTDAPATVRERGNMSRSFPKKPWRIKFDKKQQPLDAPAKAKKWTLINNYGDKTLMRNIVAFEIARRLGMEYVPWCRPVDVILNGEFKGCYQLCDQVEVNKARVNITEMEKEDTEGDALTGGYFVEVDAYADQEPAGEWFRTNRRMPVTIKSPDDGGVKEQYNYIRTYFNRLESAVFSPDFCTGDSDYRLIFDTDSFIRHLIVGELSGNTDTYWSTYMYKDRLDPVVHTGPVWDFDIAFDNDNRTYPINSRFTKNYLYDSGSASAADGMRDFVNRIVKDDPRTKDDISRIWSLARNDGGLTATSLSEFVSETAETLSQSQELNFRRWNILREWVHQNPQVAGSYSGEVEVLRSYLKGRLSVLDRIMGYDSSVSGVGSVDAASPLPVVTDGCISLPGGAPFSVFSLSGAAIFRGTGSTRSLPSGIYIVRTSSSSFKIKI